MISFKQLEKTDFSILNTWMNIDFVSRWYEKRKFVYRDVEKKYTSTTSQLLPPDSYMILFNTIPIGYAQTYLIRYYPSFASCVQMPDTTAGMDIFIGNRDYLYQGIGKECILIFVRQVVFSSYAVRYCIAGLEKGDKPAIRAYEKAGFKHLKTVHCKNYPEAEYIMALRKREEHTIYSSG